MIDPSGGWSLRRRLALIAVSMLLASLTFGWVAMYWAATIEEDQMLDARLEHLGATVLSFVEDELGRQATSDPPSLHLKTRPTAALLYRYQVWSRQGELLLRSHEAPADLPLMRLGHFGFETRLIHGEEYRVFALPGRSGDIIVQVAENIEERWAQVGVVTGYYVGFLLIPFGLVFVAGWLFLRRSLHSIDALARHVRERNPLDARPLQMESPPPREMMPILKAFDALLSRMGHALSTERRFTAVAAHEMRTPLAGLRAQAQVAVGARSDDELRDGLASVIRSVDRASHLIDQLLDLARIEGLSEELRRRVDRVDLPQLCDEVMGDLRPRLGGRRLQFTTRLEVQALTCHRFALYTLLRNLLANAIVYTPEEARIEVGTRADEGGTLLWIDDSGPGIPADLREQAFERFKRLNRNEVEGVGLGLAITLSVVELHRGRIQLLDSPLGGLRVEVFFPSLETVPQADAAEARTAPAAP